jgi:hypothetical protein
MKQFEKFIKKYEKKYDSVQEYLARYQIFKNNLAEMAKVSNEDLHENGINQFADMTKNEFRRRYLNLDISIKNTLSLSKIDYTPKLNAPESFDWKLKEQLVQLKTKAHVVHAGLSVL